jgi:GT2 family glycosyltransferase
MLDVGESDPRIGVIGPMVFHADEPTVIQSAGGVLSRRWHATHLAANEPYVGQFAEAHDVDWISGCGLLVRRAMVEHIGMLDERFYYYWEETEWCVRARRAAWRVVHVPGAKLWHSGVRRDYRPSPNVTYYDTRNRLLMFAKHDAPVAAWADAWMQTLRTLLSWTFRPRWRTMRAHRDAMCHGIFDFIRGRWGIRATLTMPSHPGAE